MSEILEIKVWYKDKLMPKIYRKRDGEWYDLFCAEDIFIPQFCERLVSLGVVIQLPEGYEASLQSRSSTFRNYGCIQGDAVGVMDNAYRGKNDIWKFPAVCINPHDECLGTRGSWIRRGDRICQFRLMKQQPKAVIREIQTVEDESRGGFGSSGKR